MAPTRPSLPTSARSLARSLLCSLASSDALQLITVVASVIFIVFTPDLPVLRRAPGHAAPTVRS